MNASNTEEAIELLQMLGLIDDDGNVIDGEYVMSHIAAFTTNVLKDK